MKVEPTIKQRALARAFFKHGCNKSKAYMEVYETDNPGNLTRAFSHPGMDIALAEEVKKNETRDEVTREWIINKYKELLASCDDSGDRNVAVRILDSLARSAGMFIEKREIKHEGSFTGLEIIKPSKDDSKGSGG